MVKMAVWVERVSAPSGMVQRAESGGSVSQNTAFDTSLSRSGGCSESHGSSGGSTTKTRFQGPDLRLARRGIHSPASASLGTTMSTEAEKFSAGTNTNAVAPAFTRRVIVRGALQGA